jgi:DNA-binding GntR family transcriptional regulator
VAVFAEADLADLASMRIALEELAVRLAVGGDPDLAPAHAALAQMRTASVGGSTYEIIAADRAFHEALIWAAGNPRLTAAYSRLRDQIQLALLTNLSDGTSVLSDIHERHVDLLDRYVATIRGGDPADLLPLLEQHIAGGMGVPIPEPWPAGPAHRHDAATA